MRPSPSEGWILTGILDGVVAMPAPRTAVAGMPHLLRDACAMASAGIERIFVVWNRPAEPPPDLAAMARDDRLAGRQLVVVTSPPPGDDADPILVMRGDRVFHRDLPKTVAAAAANAVCRISGPDDDAVVVADRAAARRLAARSVDPGGFSAELADLAERGGVVEVAPPWLGFSVAAPDRKSLARAERRLISSLRKKADGYASRWLNRPLSLLLTRLLAPTPVLPNHVTAFCALLAIAGGIAIAQGGYRAAVLGFFLVELGSIIDGTDGELSRLQYRYSRLGQWMDTVTDDLSNISFVTGTMVSLDGAGVTWAVPVGVTALVCFFLTQTTQYLFIALVYRSGDLAAIPWAFQSTESLEAQPKRLLPRLKAAIPRLLKRDVTLTVFLILALLGRIEVTLLFFATGAVAFAAAFAIQLIRHQPWRSARAP